MSVCMNRCGGWKRSVIGAVSSAIDSSLSRITSTSIEGGIGPTPDEPVSVMCGGL